MFPIFQRMGAHEQALIIDASQVFSPISIIVLWTAKLWKHPISTSWLTKEDFTRSFGAQTPWGATIRCRGSAKRVENPGAVEQFWTRTDKSRVIFKCNQMFVETDVGLALSSDFTKKYKKYVCNICNTSLWSEVVFSFSSFAKTTWWNRLFLHISTRSTCLTIFFLAVGRVFLPMLPKGSKFKVTSSKVLCADGCPLPRISASTLGEIQMVRSFPGHGPEHKEQLPRNRWFPTGLLF